MSGGYKDIYSNRFILHNINDQPAMLIYWDEEHTKLRQVCYLQHNKMHRETGPAKIFYNEKGKIINTFYYLNNVNISIEFKIYTDKQLKSYIENQIFK